MRILLDTCAWSELLRGSPAVSSLVRRAHTIQLSTVVLGELLFGFRSGDRFERNRELLESLLDNPHVECVPVTATTADRFGRIAAELRRQGTSIPSNDLWIAAHTFETGSELVTLDRHFEKVPGLPVRWPSS